MCLTCVLISDTCVFGGGKQGEVKSGGSLTGGVVVLAEVWSCEEGLGDRDGQSRGRGDQPDECEGRDLLGAGRLLSGSAAQGCFPLERGRDGVVRTQEKCPVAPLHCCFPFKSNCWSFQIVPFS